MGDAISRAFVPLLFLPIGGGLFSEIGMIPALWPDRMMVVFFSIQFLDLVVWIIDRGRFRRGRRGIHLWKVIYHNISKKMEKKQVVNYREYGSRVEIHRPSTIVREGSDAVGNEANKDWVNAFIKYVRLLKVAPGSRSNRGFLDLVPTQCASR